MGDNVSLGDTLGGGSRDGREIVRNPKIRDDAFGLSLQFARGDGQRNALILKMRQSLRDSREEAHVR